MDGDSGDDGRDELRIRWLEWEEKQEAKSKGKTMNVETRDCINYYEHTDITGVK